MFEPTSIWSILDFDQLCMWIWANNARVWLLQLDLISPLVNFSYELGGNNDQIWLPGDQMSDLEKCLNQLKLDMISLVVNLSC